MAPRYFPIHRVREDGRTEFLGTFDTSSRQLTLEKDGFPFLRPGVHAIEGELPWIFWDMCPSGFLGRLLVKTRPELHLPADPAHWTAEDCLRILSSVGVDLPGNLLVGEKTVEDFAHWQFDSRGLSQQLDSLLREEMTTAFPSSLGGQRPKLSWYLEDGTASLVKFSPPTSTELGQRWSDLLNMEHHASVLLTSVGLNSPKTAISTLDGRTLLFVNRFDRLKNRGRRGACTLYWLAASRGDAEHEAPAVMQRLCRDGLVSDKAVQDCTLAHAYSEAIGNNDAHLGNYGLVFDDSGCAELTPLYDVCPMVFAPRDNELPDKYLIPKRSIDSTPKHWMEAWAGRDLGVSADFERQWRDWVGLS